MGTPSRGFEKGSWRYRCHEIIFEADTPEGKLFDVVLLWAILFSVAVVMLETVSSVELQYGSILRSAEWFFTIIFTIEYALRLLCVRKPAAYALSFFGVVDLLAILPTYLSLIFVGSQYLVVIRGIRLLRIFRIFKLARYVQESEILLTALRGSRHKITVFLGGVFTIVIIIGAVMYLVEGPEHNFTSIPRSMYWAVVTLTTVGYGDITPQTTFGQILSAVVMILGYAIIAVPTGIMSVELSRAEQKVVNTQACPSCGRGGHRSDAKYCRVCGEEL